MTKLERKINILNTRSSLMTHAIRNSIKYEIESDTVEYLIHRKIEVMGQFKGIRWAIKSRNEWMS